MNYLALCQRACVECGVSGSPSTVTGQTGELARMITWVNAAWQDVQTAHQDWGWMRSSASFTTVASQATYALGTGAGTTGVTVATFGMWLPDTARSYVTATGTSSEAFLGKIGYDAWKNSYQFGATRTATSRPTVIAVAPDKSICLGPVPLSGYTISLDYFTAPTDLTVDADVPALPAAFHMLIVYRAMMYYGSYEAAPEVYQRGELEFKKLMQRLTADRLPTVSWGGPLV